MRTSPVHTLQHSLSRNTAERVVLHITTHSWSCTTMLARLGRRTLGRRTNAAATLRGTLDWGNSGEDGDRRETKQGGSPTQRLPDQAVVCWGSWDRCTYPGALAVGLVAARESARDLPDTPSNARPTRQTARSVGLRSVCSSTPSAAFQYTRKRVMAHYHVALLELGHVSQLHSPAAHLHSGAHLSSVSVRRGLPLRISLIPREEGLGTRRGKEIVQAHTCSRPSWWACGSGSWCRCTRPGTCTHARPGTWVVGARAARTGKEVVGMRWCGVGQRMSVVRDGWRLSEWR
jgi:hypothetical protein